MIMTARPPTCLSLVNWVAGLEPAKDFSLLGEITQRVSRLRASPPNCLLKGFLSVTFLANHVSSRVLLQLLLL